MGRFWGGFGFFWQVGMAKKGIVRAKVWGEKNFENFGLEAQVFNGEKMLKSMFGVRTYI